MCFFFFFTGNLEEEIHLQICISWILQFSSRKKILKDALLGRDLYQNTMRNLLVVEISCHAHRIMNKGNLFSSKKLLYYAIMSSYLVRV